jgi:hypothetical protein
MENKGSTRSSGDPKLIKKGYLKNLLLMRKIPPRKKDGMCTWILKGHMQIMKHGWLTRVNPFILQPTWSGSMNMKGMMDVMFS